MPAANVVTEPVELALVVGDLAGLVQLHQAGGEHLGVDAVAAAVGSAASSDDDAGRDGPDAGLQGAAVGDERRGRAAMARSTSVVGSASAMMNGARSL